MKQTTVYIIFLLLAMSEKMFIIVTSFLFGYYIGYCSFELVKSKNRKYEMHDFFSVMIKEMASSVESITKKLEEVKINDDYIFGENLSYEQSLLEKIEQEILGPEIS